MNGPQVPIPGPPLLNREQSRRADRLAVEKYGLSGLVLMENAGRGAADVLCRLGGCAPASAAGDAPAPVLTHRDFGGPVVICCGRGNNAGDGLVMARHLELRGHPVRVLLWSHSAELSGEAAANYAVLRKGETPIVRLAGPHDPARLDAELAGAAWIVDALLGTGARGEPKPPLDAVIDRLNASGAPILAVDLPSGLDCDTGQPAAHTVRAAVTCTFAAAKPGLVAPEAQPFVGRLVVLDIGAPRQVIEEAMRA